MLDDSAGDLSFRGIFGGVMSNDVMLCTEYIVVLPSSPLYSMVRVHPDRTLMICLKCS